MNSSVGGNVDNSSLAAFCHGEVVQTAAEKAREKRLRDDPMADVLGPLFVACKRCGSRIKLSPKSTYDPFHWHKHRERCLRKPVGAAKQKRRVAHDTLSLSSKKPSTSSTSKVAIGSATPPVTTDDEEGLGRHHRIKRESPSPGLGSTATTVVSSIRPPDSVLEDYLSRSRRKTIREMSPPHPHGWHEWNWSQLKAPVWVVSSYPEFADEGSTGDQAGTNDDIDRRYGGTTTATLSLLQDTPS